MVPGSHLEKKNKTKEKAHVAQYITTLRLITHISNRMDSVVYLLFAFLWTSIMFFMLNINAPE